jgi:Kef-type K+ transport system membrane component KefB
VEQATSLILIALLVFLLPLAAGRLRVPAVVLEIIVGILVGPSVLNLIQGSELLDLLADLGLFLLMFLSGFEIDFNKLERQRLSAISTGLLVFLLTLGASHLVTQMLGYGMFMTLVLATTSVGLVVPTLRATRHSSTQLGQSVLISAILADFLTLMAVALLALIHEHGVSYDLLKFPALFIAIVFVLRCLRLAVWWYPKRFARLFSADDPEELGIRVSLAFMLAFVGLSLTLDIEPILGAFLAGVVFALVFRNRGALEHRLSGFSYGFLIPIFFINVGIRFELETLLDSRSLVRAFVVITAAFAVKVIPSFALLLQKLPFREVLAAGALLSARLSLIIAVATVGVELGLLTTEDRALAILVAAATTTIAPSIFRMIAPPIQRPLFVERRRYDRRRNRQ